MSVSSINSYFASQLNTNKTLADYLSEGNSEAEGLAANAQIGAATSKLEAAGILAGKANSQKGQNAYANASSSTAQAALKRALDELAGTTNGPITFDTIAKYREQLEAEFSVKVRLDLLEKGVDPEQEFALHLGTDGKIQVECDDPAAKAVIEKYLKDNEKVCDQFGYIQALSNLERAKQNNMGSASLENLKSTKAAYQAANVQQFFSDALSTNTNFAGMIAQFRANQEDTSFYTGLDLSV